jgi:ATP-dependent RNA helicase HrpA
LRLFLLSNFSQQKAYLFKRFQKIKQAYLSDRFRLKQSLKQIENLNLKHPDSENTLQKRLQDWDQQLQLSIDKVQLRKKNLPSINYPDELPVSHKIDEIQTLFKQHQVIIVAGHTGSGKTTQLPKMCLQAGRGIYGKIAHTQPRRIAASSVAARIAEELETQLGDVVGYKIRFHDHTRECSYIKLMTDGILLAEVKTDRFMQQYDTLIIDEAHERSLNIDFLLGYIKKLLPKRADLKVIITSATINTKRFSEFFNQAPVIEVSGQTYPVEIRYHSPIYVGESDENDNSSQEQVIDINQAIAFAVNELIFPNSSNSEQRVGIQGDILVFLSGEKEIREAHKELRQHHFNDTEVIPLYARLSQAEQSRIFKPHNGRRIILSTNIAETSLTIPGIRYVIDTGLAKISRYSVHSKIQRLPVERISQASAQQRSGRCGRVSAGIAIRLYDEVDFQLRPEFTEPEILRTNLAQVILQMLVLKLGKIELFPFIDTPQQKQINDGLLLLKQIEAIKSNSKGQLSLTAIGHKLAHLSIEPRLARVVIEAIDKNVLPEILVIASALSCQDPRERPSNARQQADEKHQRFGDKRSDFISYINLWCDIQQQKKHLSQNKFRKYCKDNFLSFMRIREWQEIHSQLRTQLHELGVKDKPIVCGKEKEEEATDSDLDYMGIHLSLLSGLSGFVATRDEDRNYLACRNLSLSIHPGSGLYKKSPKWIIAAEVVETQKVYARVTAAIEPVWIEEQSKNLIKHHYYDPQWDNKKGLVFAKDKMTLYGLIINPGKRVSYGPIDPKLAHEIFIKEALVTGRYRGFHGKQPDFIKHNTDLIDNVIKLEHKSRRQDILVDDLEIYEFYKTKITQQIYGRVEFEKWSKQAFKQNKELLFMTEDDLKQHNAEHITDDLYPPTMTVNGISIPLEYHFMPSHPLDGVTAIFPLKIINQLETSQFEWLVPGLIREKITIIFRSLPKLLRRHLVPIPDKITVFLEKYAFNSANQNLSDGSDLNQAILSFLTQQLRQQFGLRLSELINKEFLLSIEIPQHLHMNYRIVDENNQELDSSRDLDSLKQKWGKQASKQVDTGYSHSIERKDIKHWDFDLLPKQIEVLQAGITMTLYPALVDEKISVAIALYDTQVKANQAMYRGLFRLYYLQLHEGLFHLLKQLDYKLKIQKLCLLYVSIGNCKQLQDEIVSSLIKECCCPETLIYTKADYNNQLVKAKEVLTSKLDEQINCLQLALDAHLQIKKLFKANIPINQIQTFQQIKQQLSQLYYPGFISQTPISWLRRFPRYIKAMEIRLQKSANDPRRDQLSQAEIESLFNPMVEKFPELLQPGLLKTNTKSNQINKIIINNQLVEYKWLLEELRISLFAQEIKTIQPVSVKRLQKKWSEINKS